MLKAIKHNKKYYEIKEVFESLEERWYWFTLVERPDKDDPSVRYGLVVGFAKEFGTFSMRDLEPLIKQGKIWRVPKRNWSSNANVVLVDKSKISKPDSLMKNKKNKSIFFNGV